MSMSPGSRRTGCLSLLPPALLNAIIAAALRLDFSLSPSKTIAKVQKHRWRLKKDGEYMFLLSISGLGLYISNMPLVLKLLIIVAYTTALLVPLTSQFFLPASPIFTWLVLFFNCRYIPSSFRSHIHIWVSILPTLEAVLYGANISDILTRYTNPLLDLLAWFPYGVLHFILPFVTAAFLFVFGGPGSVKFFAKAFGYLNIIGVLIQIFFPCAPPWYEIIYGITPASYSMPGSPGGLARIDKLFHSNGYTTAFTASPMVFGAFPSLHAGNATLVALFMSHYFPRWRIIYWTYAFVLYWSTMYLTHHYLVDLVAGGSLAIAFFYVFLTEEQRHLPMLNQHFAGEDESIAKGYHTGVRGMLGHRGATGMWTLNGGGGHASLDDGDDDAGYELPETAVPFLGSNSNSIGAEVTQSTTDGLKEPDVGYASTVGRPVSPANMVRSRSGSITGADGNVFSRSRTGRGDSVV